MEPEAQSPPRGVIHETGLGLGGPILGWCSCGTPVPLYYGLFPEGGGWHGHCPRCGSRYLRVW